MQPTPPMPNPEPPMNPGHNLNPRLNPLNHQLDLQLVRDVPITPAQASEGWTVPETLMQ
jgi:hypothetical protein